MPPRDVRRYLAAYEVDPLPGEALREEETQTPLGAVPSSQDEWDILTGNNLRVEKGYESVARRGLEDKEDRDVRAMRKKLFHAKAQIQLIEAEATLANYLGVTTETVELVGLAAVIGLVEEEVAKARGTDPAVRSAVREVALHAARVILQPSLKKGRRFRVSLKPGYEEIAQKELSSLEPSNPFPETMTLFLKLNTIGYILVDEI
jgi:hypothetical protein